MDSSVTIDDLLDLRQVVDAQIDPAGERIAFVVASSSLEKGEPSPESRVWIARADGAEPRAVTTGPGTDDLPRWSPDGRALAFRSDRRKRGTGQIYLMRAELGEPTLPREFPRGVTSFAWSPDGSRIAAIVPDEPERAGDEVLFEEEPAYARVWLLDVASGEARCLTSGPLHVWEIAWSPDGRALAALASDLPYSWSWYRMRLVRLDVESGDATTLYRPERQLTGIAWSPDGARIAAITSTWSDPGMTGGDVVVVPAVGGEARALTADLPISHLSLHWRPDGRSLLSAAVERGRAAVCEIALDGRVEVLWSDERAFVSYAMSASARGDVLAAALSDPARPPEVWLGRVEGRAVAWEPRSRVNAALAGRAVGRVETLGWRASDGAEVQGLLVRPAAGAADGPLPLVTLIHGGPTGYWPYGYLSLGLSAIVPLLVARGVAVLLPNPRGSIGWGLAFAEANHGDMGGQDLADILAGVDHCVAAGIADPDRLAVGGWSYGGYLTAWAITKTPRFKAAIAGASITDWFSFHGTTNIPVFDEIFYRADPYALDGPYAQRSPIFFVDRARTPTLFLHGERDPVCPVGQAYEMARALRARGVEARCVVYPREGHPVRERAHRRDLLERALDWLARHLDLAPAEGAASE